MRRISSRATWWNKNFFPAVWFGFLALFASLTAPDVVRGRADAEFLVLPLIVAVFGYVMLRWLVFPLVDEAWIDGDELVIRNRGEEDRFPITNIIDVEGSYMAHPEHIGIILKPASRFGKTIRFAAPYRLFMFGTHPLAQELADCSGCFKRRRPD